MNRIRYRRILTAGGLIALAIVYPLLWLRMIADPAERTGSDFIAFFAAGRVSQEYGAGNVYEPDLQQIVQEQEVGFPLVPGQVLLYNHVPYLVPLLQILVNSNYVASFVRWAVLLFGLFIASFFLLAELLRQTGWQLSRRLLVIAGSLTFLPLFVSLMNGQDTAFTILGLSLWFFGLLTGRDWLAGFGLALTTVRPHIAFFLTFPFVFRRQKILLWAGIGAGVLGLASLASVGIAGLRGFLDLLLVSAGGEWYGMKEAEMVNLVGLLWRLFPRLGGTVIHAIGWVTYAAGLVGMGILWMRSRRIGSKQASLAVILAVFLAPHLHYHDLTLLLVPLLAGILVLVQGKYLHEQDAVLLPLGISLVLLFSNIAPFLEYNFPYLLMVALVLALWFPEISFHKPTVQEKRE